MASNTTTIKIIEVPTIQSKSSFGNSRAASTIHFYRRSQESWQFDASSASQVFSKVSDLSLGVHHTVPMIYKIHFQGSCLHSVVAGRGLIRILVDNNVLNLNRLMPNTDRRATLASQMGLTLEQLDAQGGSFFYSGLTTWVCASCAKTDVVLLSPGTHIIDVGLRTDNPIARIHGGELVVEMTEYDPRVHFGFQYLTVL
ncbi:unnamed protein product [Rotaria magnacalcarata]|uniref:Uncharacterized protein n=1 Tax=Rotaria magnacalcarata TaxID=392030 RepID=A0A815WBK9_9BILA|nr:unnamed protein product [Rotaria magnacalcarata]CAF1542756.1 unnamed protein product [Rotaria magnacalcarata]CAF2132596.1 unnamed protein product [Rotaria magnacalcarata]CAF4061439.1 unnamed protein product [Rotaria magnacalcarata]CAF4104620.1 unnamed protein product [Rotaria magnacalcarata]